MFSKGNDKSEVDLEQHDLLETAHARIKQKKRLYVHFVIFLIGSVFLILINKILKYGEAYDWFIWAITFWAFLYIIHLFNVFVTQKFMGKDWERTQREKLVRKQKERIADIQKEIETEFPLSQINKKRPVNTICMIAAAGEDNALGKGNDLLWHLPDDFKRFKKLTTGHKIIMGRKTFESFPKPLPNRTHIIITRNRNFKVEHNDCITVYSLEAALRLIDNDPVSFIIGGGEIYKQGMPFSNKIELTRVHATFEDADTFFPKIDEKKWKRVAEEFHPKDGKHKFAFTYLTYARV